MATGAALQLRFSPDTYLKFSPKTPRQILKPPPSSPFGVEGYDPTWIRRSFTHRGA